MWGCEVTSVEGEDNADGAVDPGLVAEGGGGSVAGGRGTRRSVLRCLCTILLGIRALCAAVDGQGGGTGGLTEPRPDKGDASRCVTERDGEVSTGESTSLISVSWMSADMLGVVAVNGAASCGLVEVGEESECSRREVRGVTGDGLLCSSLIRSE